jgi:WhiB family redox-sensing transcriptional regulator
MFAIQAIEETETIREPVWQDLALCNDGSGSMTELFFSEQLDDIAAAKAFCAGCPVKDDCLESALTRREPWGVWGGELFVHGKVVAQKRKRGRPPKVRPELQEQEAQSA